MNTLDTGMFLCDGRSCAGSDYETLTSNSTVPDMRGKFIRMLDPTGSVDPDGAGRSLLDTQADEFRSHNHGTGALNNFSGKPNPDVTATSGNLGQFSGASNSTQQVGTTVVGGASETRPTNMAINFFIQTSN
jgi:hypothetical protein